MEEGQTDSDEHWVFGYGSLINKKSRDSTLGLHTPCFFVRLKPSFRHCRVWNFHSQTGFTALGICPTSKESRAGINGVLVRVKGRAALERLDHREKGYQRRELSAEHIVYIGEGKPEVGRWKKRCWFYIPLPENRKVADQDHPICQTYVDTVLAGCLEVSRKFAEEFVRSTSGWNQFYLYDTPMSRRPWVHRPASWEDIDSILEQEGKHTSFFERRHPEDFTAEWLHSLHGMWGVPSRNTDFVGRKAEIEAIARALKDNGGSKHGGGSSCGISLIETVGLGGVGKTQLAIEFCYRYYKDQQHGSPVPSEGEKRETQLYNLVLWVRADSQDSITKSFRGFAADVGVQGVDSMKNEHVIQEVKSRLYRTKAPWLLVFDNFEPDLSELNNPSDEIAAYLPKGGSGTGHVVITSRIMLPGFDRKHSVRLQCFGVQDSVKFLNAACNGNDDEVGEGSFSTQAATELAEKLGHLPLALAIAGSYMRRCDISCDEYAAKLEQSNQQQVLFSERPSLMDYSLGLGASLALSLEQIGDGVAEVLNALAFLGPEEITKELLKALARSVSRDTAVVEREGAGTDSVAFPFTGSANLAVAALLIAGSAMFALGNGGQVLGLHNNYRRVALASVFGMGGLYVLSGSKSYTESLGEGRVKFKEAVPVPLDRTPRKACSSVLDVDEVWSVLKTFSLLTMRQKNCASMHRLLQGLLRSRQSPEEQKHSIESCLDAISEMWSFDPADTNTWVKAGKELEHVILIGDHCCSSHGVLNFSLNVRLRAIKLLCEAALYMSMALSQFKTSKRLLVKTCKWLKSFTMKSEKKTKNALARAFLTLGKVERYCGNFENADKNLKFALMNAHEEWDMAAIYHEIGVLSIKLDQYAAAKDALNKSLAIKRGLRNQESTSSTSQGTEGSASSPSPGARQPLLTFSGDTMATIHQLAVANIKQRQLDEAEKLLRLALSETADESSAGKGGKAATLRQLGRVLEWRGKLPQSLQCLKEAQALYTEIYKKALHINVGAIEYQLGACLCRMKMFDDSLQHFSRALFIQKKVYGEDAPHLEVATTHGEMGKMEKQRGNHGQALKHFLNQKFVLEELIKKGTQSNSRNLIKLEKKLLAVLRLIKIVYPTTGSKTNCAKTRVPISAEELDAQIAHYKLKDPNNDLQSARAAKADFKELKRQHRVQATEKWKIPTQQIFVQDKEAGYSAFDEKDGFPLKDKFGKLLTKSCIKRLRKFQALHRSKHGKWKKRVGVFSEGVE